MFDKILVAYDGSDHAQKALATAAELAKSEGADLHLAHIPQKDSPPIVLGPYVSGLGEPPSRKALEEVGEKMVEKAREEAKAHGVELASVHLGEESPAKFILSTAEDVDADLIVLGRRGLGAVGALALGSVSQAVAHGAKSACMTIV